MGNKRIIPSIVLLIFIVGMNCIQKYENAENALKDYPTQDKKHGKKPKYVYFQMKPNHAQNLDYFSKILYKFMLTMGVRPYFVNLKDSVLLGIVPIDAEIDTEAILSTFSDSIDSVEIKNAMDEK